MRVLAIGKAFRGAGYHVTFHGRARPGGGAYRGEFEGFAYDNAIHVTKNRLGNALELLFGARRLKQTLETADPARTAAIIVYGSGSRFLAPMIGYGWLKGIPVVADVVEWYNYEHLRFGRFGPIALDVHLGMTVAAPRCDGVIAISSYLERYFVGCGVQHVVRMPPMVDLAEAKWQVEPVREPSRHALDLIYAGIPGEKDKIFIIMEAVAELSDAGEEIVLRLLGPSRDDLRAIGVDDRRLQTLLDRPCFVYDGHVCQQTVPRELARADYSVLLRPHKRYAEAGFPTKVVESFAAGVPVIANLTSDLAEYLHDGVEGFVIEDDSVRACAEALRRALRTSAGQRAEMRAAARARARESFDFTKHVVSAGEFVRRLWAARPGH